MDYKELLLDPRWQKKRLEILQRDGWSCRICSDKTTTLHVHHRRYKRNANPWDYDGEDLVTLCAYCHNSVSELQSEMKGYLNALPERFLPIVVGILRALSRAYAERPGEFENNPGRFDFSPMPAMEVLEAKFVSWRRIHLESIEAHK